MQPSLGDPRLFHGPPTSVHLVANYVMGDGWQVVWGVRREGEAWDEVQPELYDRLVTAELVEVLHALVEEL